VSIRSIFSRLFGGESARNAESASEAYAQGRQAEAAALWRLLAEGGDLPAQLQLAQLYERGDGVLQNFVEAERWYRSAAEPFDRRRAGGVGRRQPGEKDLSEPRLCGHRALLGCAAIPALGLDKILQHAVAAFVELSEAQLRFHQA
jgi:hypothetical protein